MSKQPEKRNPYTTVVIDQEPDPAASALPAPVAPAPPTEPPARPRGLRLLMAAGFASGGLAIALLLALLSGRLGGAPSASSAPQAVAQPATSAPAALPTSAPATTLPPTAPPATARPAQPTQAAPATVAAPAPAPGLEIGTDGSAWLFEATELELVAGEAAALSFINRAKRERHNWVLVAGDEALAAAVVAAAAQAGEAQGYLPADQAGIIAASPLVAGGARATVEFTAPVPGEYIFLCTVPGHFETGMHGRLTVRAAGG